MPILIKDGTLPLSECKALDTLEKVFTTINGVTWGKLSNDILKEKLEYFYTHATQHNYVILCSIVGNPNKLYACQNERDVTDFFDQYCQGLGQIEFYRAPVKFFIDNNLVMDISNFPNIKIPKASDKFLEKNIYPDIKTNLASAGSLPKLDMKFSKNIKFPKDVFAIKIFPYFSNDLKSQSSLIQTCQGYNQLFQPAIFQTKLLMLFQYILNGEKDKIEVMLLFALNSDKKEKKVLRKLLSTTGTITDRLQRKIEGTAYRIALACKDVSRLKCPDEGIANLIEYYLKKLPDGDVLMENQIKDQFPKNLISIQDESKKYHEYFSPIVDAVSNEEFKGQKNYQYYFIEVKYAPSKSIIDKLLPVANQAAYVLHGAYLYYVDKNEKECIHLFIRDQDLQDLILEIKPEQTPSQPLTVQKLHKIQHLAKHLLVNDHTKQVLNEFKKKLQPNAHEIIKTGFYFDDELLLVAYKLFGNLFMGVDNRGTLKQCLFWRQVIGYIQRFVPACTAQGYLQGFYPLVDENEQLKRTYDLNLYYDYFNNFGLGYSYAFVPAEGRNFDGSFFNERRLSTFIALKQKEIDYLISSAYENKKSCSLM